MLLLKFICKNLIYLSIYLSIYLYIYLSIYLSIYISIYLSISISIYVLASIVDDSAITCDEINDEKTKTVTANFNEKKKQSVKQKNTYILPAFLLITIAFLIAISIFSYLIKYKAKQHLLPFYLTNNELKKVLY